MFCAKAGLADDSDDDDDLLPITYPAIVQYDVDMEELSDGAVHDDLDEYFPLRDQRHGTSIWMDQPPPSMSRNRISIGKFA